MPKITIQYKFGIDQHVTLGAMLALEETEGKPQILVIRYVRVDIIEDAIAIKYHCRVLCGSRWAKDQRFMAGDSLINGLILVDEDELVAYTPAKEEKP